MKYKQFRAWCNDRACDGCWSSGTAIYCLNIINTIENLPFWKRERKWRSVCETDDIINKVVIPINNKIKEIYGDKNND